MTLFGFFRRAQAPSSAQTAKERLQILLAHERQDRSGPDYLPMLQKEILEVIKKYVQVTSEKVAVKLERGADMSTLEIDIELPGPQTASAKPAAAASAPAFAR
ncbi:MAG TPA: cell division topological specificity factor MinE [Alphaproteobacteria bacterium]|nr:cell division topological specificity factor MinE [Alphaproteobacteria bacterium]